MSDLGSTSEDRGLNRSHWPQNDESFPQHRLDREKDEATTYHEISIQFNRYARRDILEKNTHRALESGNQLIFTLRAADCYKKTTSDVLRNLPCN